MGVKIAGCTTGPSVSVILPLYNKADQIGRALQSAFDQGIEAMEVVVVNDGSTDDSERRLKPYRERIHYLEQKNSGASAARNRGIEASTGSFVAFLDADDWWRPGKLRTQLDFMRANEDVAWCGCEITLEHDRRGRRKRTTTEPGAAVWTVFDDWFLANRDEDLSHTPCIVVRREVLERVGMFDETVEAGQDVDLWIRIAKRFPRYGQCNMPLVHVVNLLPGCISLRGQSKCASMLRVLEKHIDSCRSSSGPEPSCAHFLRRKYLSLIRLSLALGYTEIARQALRRVPPEWRESRIYLFKMLAAVPQPALRPLSQLRRRLCTVANSPTRG